MFLFVPPNGLAEALFPDILSIFMETQSTPIDSVNT